MILDNLVFDHAHAGLFHCHLGKRDALLVCSGCSGEKDLVDLLLRVSCKLILCGSDARDRCFQLFNAVYDLVLVCFHDVSSCDMV